MSSPSCILGLREFQQPSGWVNVLPAMCPHDFGHCSPIARIKLQQAFTAWMLLRELRKRPIHFDEVPVRRILEMFSHRRHRALLAVYLTFWHMAWRWDLLRHSDDNFELPLKQSLLDRAS